MLELVQKIIFEVTGKTHVTLQTDFIQDLELNSFDIMNIISAFEDHFDAEIPTRDVWKMKTVEDAINYMEEKGYTEP